MGVLYGPIDQQSQLEFATFEGNIYEMQDFQHRRLSGTQGPYSAKTKLAVNSVNKRAGYGVRSLNLLAPSHTAPLCK